MQPALHPKTAEMKDSERQNPRSLLSRMTNHEHETMVFAADTEKKLLKTPSVPQCLYDGNIKLSDAQALDLSIRVWRAIPTDK